MNEITNGITMPENNNAGFASTEAKFTLYNSVGEEVSTFADVAAEVKKGGEIFKHEEPQDSNYINPISVKVETAEAIDIVREKEEAATAQKVLDILPAFAQNSVTHSVAGNALEVLNKISQLCCNNNGYSNIANVANTTHQMQGFAAELGQPNRKKKANPSILAKQLIKKHNIIAYDSAVYRWTGYYYQLLNASALKRLCMSEFESVFHETGDAHILNSMLNLIPPMSMDGKQHLWPANDLVVFNNGVYFLHTQTFENDQTRLKVIPHYFIKHAIEANFVSDLSCPFFDKYLYDLSSGNPRLIKRFWQALGLLLSSDVKAKRIVALIGVGGSGKSTFGDVVKFLIKDENVTAFTPKELLGRFNGERLANSAVNICMDLPNIPFDEDIVGRIKGLSGGDIVTGEMKYLSTFNYVFNGHLLFGSNYPIKITYDDEAFYRRMLILPCENRIPDNMRDIYLIDKLKCELSAIATKAILAFSEVRHNNYYFEGDECWVANTENSCTSGPDGDISLVLSFLNDRCTVINSQDVFTPIGVLYNEFVAYCAQSNLPCKLNNIKFSKILTFLVPNSVSTKTRVNGIPTNVRTCIQLMQA